MDLLKTNVKSLRLTMGMSQQSMADKIGVSKQMICMWESLTNTENIPQNRYKQIAEALSVPEQYLFEKDSNVFLLFLLNARKNEMLRQIEDIDKAREPLVKYYFEKQGVKFA